MGKGGWIKVFRSLEDWQWWHDEKMVKFFIYIIFRANTKDCYVGETLVKRGSFITSYQKMADECGFSVKQIRGMVEKLIRTNEVAKSTTSKYTIIIIKNYDKYQAEGKVDGKQRASNRANEGQTKGNRIRNKEYNPTDYKEEKERAAALEPFSSEEAKLDEPNEPEEPKVYIWEAEGYATMEEWKKAIREKWM